jgi:NADPH-dependent F420 reductase
MRVAVLGGTGDFGGGLAKRFAAAGHTVAVGSRDADRAHAAAAEYASELDARGFDPDLSGVGNVTAAVDADVAVLSAPPGVAPDLAGVVDPEILVSPAVDLARAESGDLRLGAVDGFDSVTAAVADAAAPPVVGAGHSLPAGRLADLDRPLGMDTFLVGPPAPKRRVRALFGSVAGLRPVDAGGLDAARLVEAATPLLINAAKNEGFGDAGFRVV